MAAKSLVAVRELRKSYGNAAVVDGIDFDIQEGEVLGFLGPNGAGKTTAVLMLATYLTPDNGEIRIDARLLKEKGHIPLIQKSIGYVPQEISLYEDMNAAENLLFFGKARNMGNLLGSVNRSKN